MKKLLLITLTLLCAVTLSAATQVSRFKVNVKSTLLQKANINKTQKCAAFAAQGIKSPRLSANKAAAKRVVHHLPTLENLAGAYVEDTPGSNDGIDYATYCSSVDLVDTLAVDEESGEQYNVAIHGLCQGIADVLGQYDPEDGTLTIPAQYCYYNEEDLQVTLAYIVGIAEITEQGYNTSDVLVLRVEEDENGFYITLDPDYEIGWGIVCEEGQYANYIVGVGDDLVLNPANYATEFSTIDITLPDSEKAWEDNEAYVFLEDLGDELIVHGFCGGYNNSLTVKGEGELAFRTGQKVVYSEGDGAWIGFYTFDEDGWFLCSDEHECPIVIGGSGTIYYGSVNEDNTINWDYLCMGYYDHEAEEPQGLWTGIEYAAVKLIPWEVYMEGVNTVLAPNANSNSRFNLQGQRVNTLNKGVNLWNGKKYLVK
ncbi:MAG: hypothetical protein MJZ54_03505 [Bacteroidaceae bacterium]|nr:hypothetical protein [Bacteroidaceae bacterium]